MSISVLHVVIGLDTGGLERFLLDLIRCCQRKVRHRVLCLERPGELATSCSDIQIDCLYMPPGLSLKTVLDLKSFVLDNPCHVIHTHNEKAHFYGSLAGVLAGVPVVHTKHGKNDVRFRSKIRSWLASACSKRVIAVSDDAALQSVTEEKIPRQKVMTVVNGINTAVYRPCSNSERQSAKKRLRLEGDVPVLGIVARLAPIKDHVTLLKACALLKETGSGFRLLIVGDGALMGELQALSRVLGLANEVIFLGTRSDIENLMQAMDIFVLSSLSEGISITLLEAMACCLPVVATGVGGNPEVVVDGKTGFLVPPAQPALFAEKVQVLLQERSLRTMFGKAGRARVLEKFDLSDTAHRYEHLYTEVAGVLA